MNSSVGATTPTHGECAPPLQSRLESFLRVRELCLRVDTSTASGVGALAICVGEDGETSNFSSRARPARVLLSTCECVRMVVCVRVVSVKRQPSPFV